jgi:hypothetical protein
LLHACVALGGDVDTAASIALGVTARATSVRGDLPPALIEGLEDGPWGRNLLRGRDAALRERFG